MAERNSRWCSDGFEVVGIAGEHVRDLTLAALEHRLGAVDELSNVIE